MYRISCTRDLQTKYNYTLMIHHRDILIVDHCRALFLFSPHITFYTYISFYVNITFLIFLSYSRKIHQAYEFIWDDRNLRTVNIHCIKVFIRILNLFCLFIHECKCVLYLYI